MLVAVLLLFAGVGTLIAQNPNSTGGMLDEILAAVNLLRTNVSSVQTSLNGLQTSVNSHIAAGEVNYRFSPAVPSSSFQLQCSLVNVNAARRTVRIDFRDSFNQLHNSIEGFLDPGEAVTFSDRASSYCKFTVLDGTRRTYALP
jgi:hypothetical protein